METTTVPTLRSRLSSLEGELLKTAGQLAVAELYERLVMKTEAQPIADSPQLDAVTTATPAAAPVVTISKVEKPADRKKRPVSEASLAALRLSNEKRKKSNQQQAAPTAAASPNG
jgi:hypothetical protein